MQSDQGNPSPQNTKCQADDQPGYEFRPGSFLGNYFCHGTWVTRLLLWMYQNSQSTPLINVFTWYSSISLFESTHSCSVSRKNFSFCSRFFSILTPKTYSHSVRTPPVSKTGCLM